MLLHELYQMSPGSASLLTGWDVLYDSYITGGINYEFYGIAPLGTNPAAASWWIFVYKTNADSTAAAERYYPPNQVWNTRRTALALP